MAVENPNIIVDIMRYFPAFFTGGIWVRMMPVKTPPTAGMDLNKPSPSGPIFNISIANTGNIPIIPPKRTANKSIVIVPRTNFVF